MQQLELECESCDNTTQHDVLKAQTSQKRGFSFQGTVRCSECGATRHAKIRVLPPLELELRLSEGGETVREKLRAAGSDGARARRTEGNGQHKARPAGKSPRTANNLGATGRDGACTLCAASRKRNPFAKTEAATRDRTRGWHGAAARRASRSYRSTPPARRKARQKSGGMGSEARDMSLEARRTW